MKISRPKRRRKLQEVTIDIDQLFMPVNGGARILNT